MNQDIFDSHLAAIHTSDTAYNAIFSRVAAVWRLAQAVLEEYRPRFDEAGLNFDQVEWLCSGTIFAYSDRYPTRVSLNGTTKMVTLSLKEPYGDHDTDTVQFPYSWITLTDAELTAHFQSILDGWVKSAQDKRAEQERQDEIERRAQYERLKIEFESTKS